MIPPITELQHLFFNEEACITFLFEQNILYNNPLCEHCGSEMRRYDKLFRCKRKACRRAISIFKDSFSAKGKLRANEVLFIGYLWLVRASHSIILLMTNHSKEAITNYINFYRELIAQNLIDNPQIIGGPGVVVEIDESKFGKRKYHRGHRVEGVWVVGGVERTNERRIFVEAVENRTAETLLEVIQRNVAPGSIVRTDIWRGYNPLEQIGMEHLTVNHEEGFVNPENGTHTNTIEGTWNGIKLNIMPRNRMRANIQEHLLEFIWRRQNAENLWEGLLTCLREVGYFE